MTGNGIIKVLKCCKGYLADDCIECPYVEKYPQCTTNLRETALDLINRQKAEIERLNAKILAKDNTNDYNTAQLRIAREELNKYPIKTVVNNNCEIHSKTSKDYDDLMTDIKSEAIKEFVERLKSEYEDKTQGRYIDWLMNDIIDNLVKEMTEDANG